MSDVNEASIAGMHDNAAGAAEPRGPETLGQSDPHGGDGDILETIAGIIARAQRDPLSAFAPECVETLRMLRRGDLEIFENTRERLKLAGVGVGRLDVARKKLDVAARKAQRKGRKAVSTAAPGAFRLTGTVLEKRIETENGTEWHRVCSGLEVIAETRNTDGKAWGRFLRVTTREGQSHEWAMPMELLAGDGTAVRAQLLHLGLDITPGKWARDALQEYISTARPAERVRCVERLGWHGSLFVFPDLTYGGDGHERVLLQGAPANTHALRVAGSIEEWQENIGRYAVGNSRLAFSISAAFAAPLLGLLHTEGGGFNLRGGSSTGKTTSLHVAGSVCGGGGIGGYVQSWRATANGLEGVATAHCDLLLCLDELGQIDARDAGSAAYMLANGAGKTRASRDGSLRSPAEWRVLFLSTGEIGLADKIQEDGRRVAAGQQLRVVDIPADAGAGLGLFEALHGFKNGDAFARHLKSATGTVYGTPIRAFLEQLVSDVDDIKARVADSCKQFVAAHCPPGACGQVSRVAERFAMVAAAGELATGFGVLPWPEGQATEAAAICFKAWLQERGGDGAAEIQAGMEQVRSFIEQNGESRFTPWELDGEQQDHRTINRVGFRRPNNCGGTDYFILAGQWKRQVCTGSDSKMIADELLRQGHLVSDGDGKPYSRHRLPGMDGASRCYQLRSSILGEGDG